MIQPPWPKMRSAPFSIVEDDDGVRGFLTFALESGGYTALGVRTGEEAMAELHRTTPPAVILIDGILPDMHGVRLARAILEEPGLRAPRHQLCDRGHSRRPAARRQASVR